MCLVHSLYAGCNNNMGVEVSWREIKKLCDCMASLGQFIRCLCHFINLKTALGEEHIPVQRLGDAGNSFASQSLQRRCGMEYRTYIPRHSFSVPCWTIPLGSRTFRYCSATCWRRCGTLSTPLHLKIATWQADVKTILKPRQALLRKLDPSGSYCAAVRFLLEPYQREYQSV